MGVKLVFFMSYDIQNCDMVDKCSHLHSTRLFYPLQFMMTHTVCVVWALKIGMM